jgi:hypothetical protein
MGTPSMVTQRDLLEAQRYARSRLMVAFLSATDPTPRSALRPILLGLVVAIGLVAVTIAMPLIGGG